MNECEQREKRSGKRRRVRERERKREREREREREKRERKKQGKKGTIEGQTDGHTPRAPSSCVQLNPLHPCTLPHLVCFVVCPVFSTVLPWPPSIARPARLRPWVGSFFLLSSHPTSGSPPSVTANCSRPLCRPKPMPPSFHSLLVVRPLPSLLFPSLP